MNGMGVTTHFFISFKSHSLRGNPYLAPLSGQESMVRQIIGPRKVPATIMLLKGHIEATPNELLVYP